MKKALILFISVFCLLSALIGCTDDTDPYPTEDANPISDFEYRKSDDQTGIIIEKYVGTDQTVVIPQKIDGLPVTVIGHAAFIECDITSLMMPDSVTDIYTYAIAGCTGLTEVRLSKNLQVVGECSFRTCTSLTQMDLSMSSLTHIYNEAFEGCTALQQVTFGDNIEFIGVEAFQECTSLHEAILPKHLREVGDYAFALCTAMQKIHIPKGLEVWGTYAFAGDSSVTEITFEDGLKTIGDREHLGCFSDCPVETVTIPADVEYLTVNAFLKFPNLKEVIFKGSAPNICEDAFVSLTQMVIYYDPATEGWDDLAIRNRYTLIPVSNHDSD